MLNFYWLGSFLKVLYNKIFVHGGYVITVEGDLTEEEIKAKA